MEKKWALVTGASSGIGEATAEQLFSLGYKVILMARRDEKLKKIAQKFQSSDSLIAKVDLLDVKAVAAFFTANQAILQNLEVLVNNAGLAMGVEKVQEAKLSDWDIMLDTNVRALMHVTRMALPFLIQQQKAQIINLGSVAGRWVYPGGAVYCATKFAVRAFSEGLRQDLIGKNIRVCNIEPGMVETEFSKVRLGDQVKADAVYAGMQPLLAKDIAETIAWVLQRPAHVNIQELVVYPTDQAHVGQVHRRSL